jgi:uncharacterized radical SAM superfamily Fe-S cluster-containing enzyme
MLYYNVGDIYANEELYYRFRPWMDRHPNLSLYNTIMEKQCPNCLCTEFTSEGYYPPTAKSRYEAVRCNHCGALSRLNVNVISPAKRRTVLSK